MTSEPATTPTSGPAAHGSRHGVHAHGGHGWLMIACCIPMLVVAGLLVASGAVSVSFLLFALGCTAMMALMMRGMSASTDETDRGDESRSSSGRPDPS